MDKELEQYKEELLEAVMAFKEVLPEQTVLANYMENKVRIAAASLKWKLQKEL